MPLNLLELRPPNAPILRLGERDVPFFDYASVVERVPLASAIECVREAFIRSAEGLWDMPPKVYLSSPPAGDFRAMPVRGGGLALVKWVSSFPLNRGTGVPSVSGIIIVNDASTGEILALVDGNAVTSLRTGASAAVASIALAPRSAHTAGIIGCGTNGRWAALCLKEVGYLSGVCFDSDSAAADSLARELGWNVGAREDALACDIVTTVSPGAIPVMGPNDLRPGHHINALGADGPGKAELDPEVLSRCRLFCDQWEQASHGGEIAQAAADGWVSRADVTEIGSLLAGSATGRNVPSEVTLFDSTGLAVQDLAIVNVLLELETEVR